MDRLKLSSIDEELDSSEVAALCFLCRDVVYKKRLEGIEDAKKLFLRLEEKGLLDNHLFLRQLLQTIGRADLLNFLETDSRRPEETDANPMLSEYRVLLYKVYADMTNENFEKMKFLLSDKLGKRQIETCKTALDVFAEMEKNANLLSNTNLRELHATLLELDQQLALTIQRYMDGVTQLPPQNRCAHVSVDYQRVNNPRQPTQPIDVSMPVTQPGDGAASVCPDAAPHIESTTLPDHVECRLRDADVLPGMATVQECKSSAERFSMAAKDKMRRNKTDIQMILSGDHRLILNKVYENKLITRREYKKLKSINKEDEEGHVIELVDKIMDKGEDRCQGFLNLLQTDDDIQETFPDLKNILFNDACLLPRPVQASSVHESDVLPQESKRQKEAVAQRETEHLVHRMELEKLKTQIAQQEQDKLINCYAMIHKPHGLCVIINNEEFLSGLTDRLGTQQDERALRTVFTRLGFKVVTHNNLTAGAMRRELQQLGSRNFLDDDALVVCVLSHGEKECVFGTDEQKVKLRELTKPFTSGGALTLAGKPKLFFIQACQGSGYQRGSVPCTPRPRQEEVRQIRLEEDKGCVDAGREDAGHPGSMPCPPRPRPEEGDRQSHLEEDAGRVHGGTVPCDADFLLGMATVPESKTFRNTVTGSIYIQELCTQLTRAAESSGKADILDVLTRVNREVSKGEYGNYKQMPEIRNTLTKKLVLKFV